MSLRFKHVGNFLKAISKSFFYQYTVHWWFGSLMLEEVYLNFVSDIEYRQITAG